MFDLEPAITLPWLVRLRWALVVGQIAVWLVVRLGFGVTLATWPFALAVIVPAASNIAISRGLANYAPANVMGAALLLDIVLLTAQLAGLGGAANPFTVMYLVYITLSAVVLSARWTTAVALLAIVGFALLFAAPAEMHVHSTGSPLRNPHLQGMWAALVVAAGLTAFFVRTISNAIAVQRGQIVVLREAAARNARHAALTTLAAGAAHELNNPLSTIAVAAHEAHLRAQQLADGASVADDLKLILDQVERCQRILHQMAARVATVETTETTTIAAIVDDLRAQLGTSSERLDVRGAEAPTAYTLPAAALTQSVVALIKNAFDASDASARVAVDFHHRDGELEIKIDDRGCGIPAEMLGSVGEPFFTTKAPGKGMGLGVFLARAFFESHGGELELASRVGAGTSARGRLPVRVTP